MSKKKRETISSATEQARKITKRRLSERFKNKRAAWLVGICLLLVAGAVGSTIVGTRNHGDSANRWFSLFKLAEKSAPVNETSSAQSTTTSQLSKEYIYAGGRMLAVEAAGASASPTPTPETRTSANVALSINGGVASASSEQSAPSVAIDGIRNWATSGAWKDATPDSYPDWLQVDFNGSKTINEINVFAVKDDYLDPTDPTETTTFTLYGITDYNVQYWNGSNWITVTGGNITGNNKVWRKITFTSITTTKIRVVVNGAQASYSRIVELEAWSGDTVTPTPTPTVTPTPTPNVTPTPTPTPTPGVRTNVALTANGGVGSASSELSAASIAIDGVKNWATTGAWKDATPDSYPDWLQVDFNGSKTINEIDVFAVTDDFSNPVDPTETTTFSLYGITNFDVQYWTGSAWQTVPNGSITNNNKVITKITFSSITTNKIRVVVNNAQASYSRIVELEAWSGGSSSNCSYSINPINASLAAAASSGNNIAVTVTTGCSWTAAANNSWITVTGGSSGSGNGTVTYSVAANTGAGRSGTITIAGQTFTVNQAAASTCGYSINPTSANVAATSSSGSVTVTATTGCSWTAAANNSWITITGGTSGTGNGNVSYSVAANTGGSRSGTITVAGQTFTISQAAGATSPRTNVALASNGGTATASSELSAASIAIDGVKNWATTGAWKDATPDSYPDWLQVDFNGSKTINEIDVFAVTDDFSNPVDPTETTTFTAYGITDYNVQYWNGSSWLTVSGGNITGNNKVWKKITFSAITTTKIRVVVNNAQASYSRIVELEAWTDGVTGQAQSDTMNQIADFRWGFFCLNTTTPGNWLNLFGGPDYAFLSCQTNLSDWRKFRPAGSDSVSLK
jgi:uncharacterized protein (UPF0248 family)